MLTTQRKILLCRVAIVLLAIAIASVILFGYILVGQDRYGEMRDGFGRLLDSLPGTLGWILPQWAGMIWFVLDCIGISLCIVAIDRLLHRIKAYRLDGGEDM